MRKYRCGQVTTEKRAIYRTKEKEIMETIQRLLLLGNNWVYLELQIEVDFYTLTFSEV